MQKLSAGKFRLILPFAFLFDHFVDAGEQRRPHRETKHPSSFGPNERAAEALLVFLDVLDKMS
jgi:hypothetical protein